MRRSSILLPILLILFSCSNDAYDTGDGYLSNMRADFVEAQTNSYANVIKVETDDGDAYTLTKSPTLSWATMPDTVYRALLYYNKVETSSGTFQAEPISISQVPVLYVYEPSYFDGGILTDPIILLSAWKSKNGKYINLDFYIKVGSSDGTIDKQVIGMVYEGTELSANGKQHVNLRLYHSQNGVPEYYSSESYLSIPISAIPDKLTEGDEVKITINTYDGEITKTFVI